MLTLGVKKNKSTTWPFVGEYIPIMKYLNPELWLSR